MMSSGANNLPPHSMNDLEDRLTSLSVNAIQHDMSPTGLLTNHSLGSVPMNSSLNENLHSINSRSSTSIRGLNPGAQVFVPRSMISSPNSTAYSSHPTSAQSSTNSHAMSNGSLNTIQSASLLDGENDIEDYVALSYLKEFIGSISNKPSIYDMGISEITCIVNSYLDEDECVLELIVNQIVDQSIIDVNFRYNGVRLCFHFMENVRPTNSGQTFKNILFKRCQRECSRKVSQNTSANTFNHLRGLSLFTADLFARSKAPQLAENLPNLLMNILSSNTKTEENVKCVCQVLKLCGPQLDSFFNGKDDVKNVLKKLGEIIEMNDISSHICDMVKNIIKLAERGWAEQQKAPTTTNIKNPYQNNGELTDNIPVNSGFYTDTYNSGYSNNGIQDMYDFGGDEFDEEVCNDFENFLRNLPPENS